MNVPIKRRVAELRAAHNARMALHKAARRPMPAAGDDKAGRYAEPRRAPVTGTSRRTNGGRS